MKKRKLIQILIFILPGLAAMVLVFLKIFPSSKFYYNRENLDKSNLIIGNDNSFSLHPGSDFEDIKVEVELAEESQNIQDKKMTLRKGYAAYFYPISKKNYQRNFEVKKYLDVYYVVTDSRKKLIPSQSILKSYVKDIDKIPEMSEEEFKKLPLSRDLVGFLDGTLIEYKDAVFVIGNSNRHLISSPLIFDQLGYDWDAVVQIDPEEARIHSRSPNPLTLQSAHPDGTIFFDGENYYLVDKGELIELDKREYLKYFSFVKPVLTQKQEKDNNDSLNSDKVRTCSLNDKLVCEFNLDKAFKNQIGNAYYFKLSDKLEISQIKVVFERKISLENLKLTLRKFR
ncbi:MAG: hypothetical protein GF335_03260 [Candidatus Moranbacteria bacterium]|nr:hypothetical protein [Candidatus Moranbacteria bacterium]